MKLRVMVVDDEECIRDTFKWYLEDRGHEVITVGSPLNCPTYENHDCNNDDPCANVLFIDYFMPKMTGLEFVDLMRRKGCKVDFRNIFIMSGNTDILDGEKIKSLGCNVIQKPITLDNVDKLIELCRLNIDPSEKLSA